MKKIVLVLLFEFCISKAHADCLDISSATITVSSTQTLVWTSIGPCQGGFIEDQSNDCEGTFTTGSTIGPCTLNFYKPETRSFCFAKNKTTGIFTSLAFGINTSTATFRGLSASTEYSYGCMQ